MRLRILGLEICRLTCSGPECQRALDPRVQAFFNFQSRKQRQSILPCDLTQLLPAQFVAIQTVRVGPDHRVRRIRKVVPEKDTVGPRKFGQETQCVLVSGQCQVVVQALCILHELIHALRPEVAVRQHVRDPACEIGELLPRMVEDDLAARVFADSVYS